MRKDGFASSLPLLTESKSGPLTHPEELRRLFDEIDSNKNGCLDKSELQVGSPAASLLCLSSAPQMLGVPATCQLLCCIGRA